ncbi:MAG: VCBS repeat-containing protein [Pseudomonadota bacterium]
MNSSGQAGQAGQAGHAGQAGQAGHAGRDAGGDAGEGGQDAGDACPTVAFVNPADGAKLTDADDIGAVAGESSCSDGFQYDVKVFTSAADGTKATLFSGNNRVADAAVTSGFATFAKAQLSIGSDALSVHVGNDVCTPARANITVSCEGLPTCDITKPVISVTHPALNGVPAAQGGDRASAAGSPYQAAFEVTTNIEDGRPVNLQVNSSSQLVTALANGGTAKFAGVPLSPDGEFTVVATCRTESGKTSQSGVATFTVDTTAPDITVSEPAAGKHFGPDEDSDAAAAGQQFKVCATTESLDALNLPNNLGAAQNNFCVALGSATPVCTPATGQSGEGACVTLTCQDRVPFDLKVTLGDSAGNKGQTTVQGVSCTSALPGIAIVDPVDGTGVDIATHILAASATSGRKDESSTKAGAQFTVVACTDVPNAPMTLSGAVKSQTAQSLGTTTSVAAVAADNCPVGKSYVGKFAGVTLPESQESSLGALVNPTRLSVTVNDQGTTGTSPAVDVWVDSVSPSINEYIPSPLCGSLIQSTTAIAKAVTLLTSAVPVNATVTNNGTTTPYTAATADIGHADLGQVVFGLGVNTLVATTVDPAGNPGALVTPCTVTVGNPPHVTWSSPLSKLNVSSDTDTVAAGWQGALSVQTDLGGVAGATIQFSTGAGNLGTPVAIDGTGKATSPVLTVADAASVTLTATTSDVPGRGIGSAKQTVVVDTLAPSAIADIAATIPPALRRQTTFHLAWTSPDDHGSAVTGYDVRIAKGTPITGANFDAQEQVPYTATPAATGATDGLDTPNRMIENNYYFAAAAIDKGGNRGPIAFAGPTAAHFNSTTLSTGVTGEMFGYVVDGSTSLDGDIYSDLVVGAYNSNTVYIYMGSATGYPSSPTATIVGSTTGFGRSAAVVGDIDSDGLPDLAIGSPIDGSVYIFKGRHPWPTSLQQSNADYLVQTSGLFAGSLSGFTISRLGDFNADTIDDFAVSAPLYGSSVGRISVVYGVPVGTPFGTVSLPTDFGTRALAIDGSGVGALGQTLIGLGRYYAGGGSTLVAGAPSSAGNVLAYHGLAGQVGPVTAVDQAFAGPLAGGRAGFGLAFLGGGGSVPVVGIGSPASANNPANGQVDLFAGSVATGPFSGAHAVYTDSKATSVGDAFGVMVAGSAFTNGVPASLLGDSAPDVVLGGLLEGGAATHIYLMTGQNAMTPGTRDIVTAADVSYQMPAGWQGCSSYSGPIRDLNGDPYGDLAIGEWRRSTGYNGQVLVLW